MHILRRSVTVWPRNGGFDPLARTGSIGCRFGRMETVQSEGHSCTGVDEREGGGLRGGATGDESAELGDDAAEEPSVRTRSPGHAGQVDRCAPVPSLARRYRRPNADPLRNAPAVWRAPGTWVGSPSSPTRAREAGARTYLVTNIIMGLVAMMKATSTRRD
jgi:hypothetical protein